MATITVTTLIDENNDTLTGGISLREAIAAANDGDTIKFDTSTISNGTINLTNGQLEINKSLTINGDTDNNNLTRNITLDAREASRIFSIGRSSSNSPDPSVTIDGLTITGGSESQGGGINNDGGNLILRNSTISGNSVINGGGGILNIFGTANISNSIISNNYAGIAGIAGGGIASLGNNLNRGSISISDSTISGNTAYRGGGVYSNFSTVTITNSTISGNTTASSGGGVFNGDGAIASISNSTISSNMAGSPGGGVFNDSSSNATVLSTIIAVNVAPSGPDVQGIFTDFGNNLIGNATGSSGFSTSELVGNVTVPFVINPSLGPLKDNGGSTFTQALLPGSPAIDEGINFSGLTTDQRGSGFLRGVGSAVDIGAFELQTFDLFEAVDDEFNTDEDTALSSGNVLTNDTGNNLTVTRVNNRVTNVGSQITLTSGALLTLNSDGTFEYDPNGQFENLNSGDNSSDTFFYTLSDGTQTDVGAVEITITGVEDVIPLAAINDSFTTDEDTTLLRDVTNNDTGSNLSVSAVNGQSNIGTQITLPSGALLTLNSDGIFEYNPNNQFENLNPGDNSSDSFEYTLSDGSQTDTATVTLTITGVEDVTTFAAIDDSFSTDENTALSSENVLSNDVGENLTVTKVNNQVANVGSQITLTSGALLTLNQDGNFTYNPNGQFEDLADGAEATDGFNYTLSDDTQTDVGAVEITIIGVTGENPIPTSGNDTLSFTDANDTVRALAGNDLIAGNGGNDRLIGQSGDDTLTGGADEDTLNGGNGNDSLIGGSEDDRLSGGSNNDILIGVDPDAINPGDGERDRLQGGAGADVFVLGNASGRFYDDGDSNGNGKITNADGNASRGLILDFDTGVDTIQLNGNPTDYRLGLPANGNTNIVYRANGVNDLIGIVKGVQGLSLESSSFSFEASV